jgi:hypothetical protein
LGPSGIVTRKRRSVSKQVTEALPHILADGPRNLGLRTLKKINEFLGVDRFAPSRVQQLQDLFEGGFNTLAMNLIESAKRELVKRVPVVRYKFDQRPDCVYIAFEGVSCTCGKTDEGVVILIARHTFGTVDTAKCNDLQ